MLRNTFCHIPGIGQKTEQGMWARGILSWNDIACIPLEDLAGTNSYFLRHKILESVDYLADGHARYFSKALPASEAWRLFADFRHSAAYLDIETDGLLGSGTIITTIAMYDGKTVRHYVRGRNLEEFLGDVSKFKLIVTYNGKCFDVPVIEKAFGTKLDHAHIDLRYVLKSLGYTGGLKGCEKKMGMDRKELDGVDGYFAVLLWRDFIKNNNAFALETLLSYNVLDAVNLETLMVTAYNLKLKATPFERTHSLEIPAPAENPFVPHRETIARIMNEYDYHL